MSYPTVPGQPPQNVTAANLSSTSIDVQWEPPPQEFFFGILRGYIIRYVPVGNISNDSAYLMTNLIEPTETNYTLELLMEFVNYSIEVTAVTVGNGPFSDPVYVRTNADGMSGLHSYSQAACVTACILPQLLASLLCLQRSQTRISPQRRPPFPGTLQRT